MSILSLWLKGMRNSGLSKKKEKFLCANINDVGKKKCAILPCLFYRLVLALPCQHTLGQSYWGSLEPAWSKPRCMPDFPSCLPLLPTTRAQNLQPEPMGWDHFVKRRATRSPDLQVQVLFFQTSLSGKT